MASDCESEINSSLFKFLETTSYTIGFHNQDAGEYPFCLICNGVQKTGTVTVISSTEEIEAVLGTSSYNLTQHVSLSSSYAFILPKYNFSKPGFVPTIEVNHTLKSDYPLVMDSNSTNGTYQIFPENMMVVGKYDFYIILESPGMD